MTLTTEQLRERIGHLKERLRDMKQHKYPEDCPNATAYLESLKAERQQDIALLEELLANREAHPVASEKRKLFTCSGCGAEGLDEPLESRCHCMADGANWVESALYTAPPAPAVNLAPDFEAWFNSPEAGLRVVNFHIQHELQLKSWNACCAAMFNGALIGEGTK
ncbi:hypothetical protein [Serratia inhibens]|uniref:hypothetical protein n=1 Tax=Serratia inhibens TaxID=2338073 RepID=UPI000809232F|nr:hypothetical protein [Serratia inhibens]ANS42495.1 hypothetical protein Q5A_010175 [Serratia inhibens PRI-2C]